MCLVKKPTKAVCGVWAETWSEKATIESYVLIKSYDLMGLENFKKSLRTVCNAH